MNHLIIFFKLLNKFVQIWHLQVEIVALVALIICQIINMGRCLHEIWHITLILLTRKVNISILPTAIDI